MRDPGEAPRRAQGPLPDDTLACVWRFIGSTSELRRIALVCREWADALRATAEVDRSLQSRLRGGRWWHCRGSWAFMWRGYGAQASEWILLWMEQDLADDPPTVTALRQSGAPAKVQVRVEDSTHEMEVSVLLDEDRPATLALLPQLPIPAADPITLASDGVSFADRDGDVIIFHAAAGGGVCYTVNGEPRPVVEQARADRRPVQQHGGVGFEQCVALTLWCADQCIRGVLLSPFAPATELIQVMGGLAALLRAHGGDGSQLPYAAAAERLRAEARVCDADGEPVPTLWGPTTLWRVGDGGRALSPEEAREKVDSVRRISQWLWR
eukprot:TRINITY_DN26600_c0_g1_i1.p2 TRINITY_DN26600_c0_g1~~TRINITY_DN26600_c0_g1_i1.p2  ORF type:complete len:350 (+),score=89.56 TRINITY_DN26600_c0_g1_i1:78-1052(+)